MRFLAYTPVSQDMLSNRLGTAEYSYRFVLKGYLPVLETLGEVIEIRDPQTEADPLYEQARAAGEDCVLLCFCPPNLAPVGLQCPTVTVVAWEFDSIPTDAWHGDSRNDWRTVLSEHGHAITLSTHSRETFLRSVDADLHVEAIPVPVFDRWPAVDPAGHQPKLGETTFSVRGRVVDSRRLAVSADRVEVTDPLAFCSESWSGEAREFSFTDGSEGAQYLIGFYTAEPWGAWSRIVDPEVMLPFAIVGKVRITLKAAGYRRNIGRKIDVIVGSTHSTIELGPEPQTFSLTLDIAEPTNVIRFSGLDASVTPGSFDIRTMGIALMSMKVEAKSGWRPWRRKETPTLVPPDPDEQVQLSGVVYTSVLNPDDGRKNWFDIVSAFGYALGDRPDATLLLKMTHHSLMSFLGEFLSNLRVIGPTAARIIAVHGYLPDPEFAKLMSATTYYVNASHGEGLCLPLMEFMSVGVPAVAPDHTAMGDYVTGDSTFIVDSSPMPTTWPNDPDYRIRTRYHRIDWQSLVDQFRASYQVATSQPQRYQEMSAAAIAEQAAFSSDTRVSALINGFLTEVPR